MPDFANYLLTDSLTVAVEIAVIAVVLTAVFAFLRGTRAEAAIRLFGVILALGLAGSIIMNVITARDGAGSSLPRLAYLYDRLLTIAAVALAVVFQPELRHAVIRIGHGRRDRSRRGELGPVIDAVADAAASLSRTRTGALIAIERRAQLGGIVESGVVIDAAISAELLRTIFVPNTPLHDLGVVLRGTRILAANVQFPLVEQGTVDATLGSRHRAAVGLTVDSDCIVVVVSEETGTISVAERGRLDQGYDQRGLADTLLARLSAAIEPARTADPASEDSSAVSDGALPGAAGQRGVAP